MRLHEDGETGIRPWNVVYAHAVAFDVVNYLGQLPLVALDGLQQLETKSIFMSKTNAQHDETATMQGICAWKGGRLMGRL